MLEPILSVFKDVFGVRHQYNNLSWHKIDESALIILIGGLLGHLADICVGSQTRTKPED